MFSGAVQSILQHCVTSKAVGASAVEPGPAESQGAEVARAAAVQQSATWLMPAASGSSQGPKISLFTRSHSRLPEERWHFLVSQVTRVRRCEPHPSSLGHLQTELPGQVTKKVKKQVPLYNLFPISSAKTMHQKVTGVFTHLSKQRKGARQGSL